MKSGSSLQLPHQITFDPNIPMDLAKQDPQKCPELGENLKNQELFEFDVPDMPEDHPTLMPRKQSKAQSSIKKQ